MDSPQSDDKDRHCHNDPTPTSNEARAETPPNQTFYTSGNFKDEEIQLKQEASHERRSPAWQFF